MNVLVGCECSGRVREAFRARGHNAYSCDIEAAEDGSIHHFRADLMTVIKLTKGFWDILIAHPPCTRLANSGVRWLHKPPPGKTHTHMMMELEAACAFYLSIRDCGIPKIAIENPLMHRYAKQRINPGPRQIVQPFWFGHPEFKATGFELIGLPPLEPTNVLTPPESGTRQHDEWSKVHRMSPGPNRQRNRSRTYLGVAQAMAAQWG